MRLISSLGAIALTLASQGAALAATVPGSYYTGTSIASNPVLWVYAPSTNLIKLCYATTGNSLACTPTQPVFASTPVVGDSLQYRISQQSQNGGLWILDLTSNKEALCTAAIPASAYVITCTLGAGIK